MADRFYGPSRGSSVALQHWGLAVGNPARHSWVRSYLTKVRWSDAAIVTLAVLAAQAARFGASTPMMPNGDHGTPAIIVSVLLAAAWILALGGFQSIDRRIIGSGPQEYSRVLTASLAVFGLLAIVDLAFRLNIARGFLLLAFPIGAVALLVSRWLWRQSLIRQRRRLLGLDQVLVVGGVTASTPLVERLIADPCLGYEVIGVVLPPSFRHSPADLQVADRSIPVFENYDDVSEIVAATGATAVAVTSADALGHAAMQELSWELEGMDVDMLIAPGVNDIAGPRMMVRPVAGLPLLHIDKPQYEGATRLRKAVSDRVGAALIMLAALPVMVAVAVAIKLDSPGPIFYRATRIGHNNEPFKMWKFRSMVQNADQIKSNLVSLDEGAGVLFKLRADPRVTRVGEFIRKYSLDELPQLFNVLNGTMSLVGPRPPLADEVEQYDGRVARRMLVKPGLTGLWQVSGRSDLSWEESVRLDLSYVENWSLMQDVVILWRTVRAVLTKDGAY